MFSSSYIKISPKEGRVLQALFEYRGVTIDQLLKILGYDQSGKSNMYKPIRALIIRGLISTYSLMDIKKYGCKMYYLSHKGYQLMLEHLKIPINYKGKGFNEDYGDFPYNIYKPPNTLKNHHIHLVDFLIAANDFKNKIKELEADSKNKFDFRDNRYASREYKIRIEKEGTKPYIKTVRFRPDAEILIHSDYYFVEIDLGTERGVNLEEKFHGYKQYFQHLEALKEPLPSGILFVSESLNDSVKKNRRWQSIAKNFYKVLGDYATKVNLIYESIDKIQEVFIREYTSQNRRRNALALIDKYRSHKNYNGSKISYIDKQHGGFEWGRVSFSISNIDQHKYVFAYERVDGYETKGWEILWRYKEYMDSEGLKLVNFQDVKGLTPVLFYTDHPPEMPLKYQEEKYAQYFSNRLLFKVQGQTGVWQDKNLQDLSYNPLITIKEQT